MRIARLLQISSSRGSKSVTSVSHLRNSPLTSPWKASPQLNGSVMNTGTTAKVMDGTSVAEEIKKETALEVLRMKESIGVVPGLAVIQVGDRKDSTLYVRKKQEACKSVGINSYEVHLAQDSSEQEVLKYISHFNNDPLVHGILVQLPLPSHMKRDKISDAICVEKDVDGFNILNRGLLHTKDREPLFVPCTAKGSMELLDRYGICIQGKSAVVIGRSDTVGMPCFHLLQRRDATVTLIDSRTKNPDEITRGGDIIISAAGQPNMVRGSWIKPGSIVIDIGINHIEDHTSAECHRLVGDVCFEEVSKVASFITPVPGGVGPMTVAMLLTNTLTAAKRACIF